MLLLVCIILFVSPAVFSAPIVKRETTNLKCGEHGDCLSSSTDCNQICGCDNLNYFNETLNECVFNVEYLNTLTGEKYNLEEKIRNSADKVFEGVRVSGLMFVTCAALFIFAACAYCGRINYFDRKLRSDVKALAEKLYRDGKLSEEGKIQKPGKQKTQPVAESCNVIVEDAGIFVC